ncbi:MAG TPA: deacetylase [Burkholderiales bacterium]|nr:deacetylase [Burkholderiales bacterium]
MPETPFIVTVDTEGDNLWHKPRAITTRNAAYLPRFQRLCEKYRFKPVYLTNYEMAMSDVFVDFARDVVSRGAGEVGMHLHAWNSPPLEALTGDDFSHQPYLIEYPDRIMREKIRAMTRLLEDRFGRKMVSHRAGRWAFDARYADMLLDEGYLVDCSVTPGVDWSAMPGDPAGSGGSDYTSFPDRPYRLATPDISNASSAGLLEVPMTVLPSRLFQRWPWAYRLPHHLRRIVRRISPERRWLCPVALLEKHNLDAMLELARRTRDERPPHLEFMLHSSELMPGGSPMFQGAAQIDRLYETLEILFEELARWCRGMTLAEFRDHWVKTQELAPAPVGRKPAGAAANENSMGPG